MIGGPSNLMFRDLGGHLDTTFRGLVFYPWLLVLGSVWSLLVLVLIFALPLDFHGRFVCSGLCLFLAALHGIEASLLASD